MQLVEISDVNFVTLVRSHKRRLVEYFQNNLTEVQMYMNKVTDEHKKLQQLVTSDEELSSLLTVEQRKEFSTAWKPVGLRFPTLQNFCCGIATVIPTTSCVEGDFSLMHYRKDDHCARLSEFSLEGCLHAKQFQSLKKAASIDG